MSCALADVGKSVKLVGWMENVREVGSNLAFVVLRDFYGTTQVVAETEDMLAIIKGLNKESTISVEGVVRERASKNPKLATGEIEVVPSKIAVSGPLPLQRACPLRSTAAGRPTRPQRLKYRYLDLRNPAVKHNIILRCQRGGRPAAGHDGARLPGDHHPHPHRLLSRRAPGTIWCPPGSTPASSTPCPRRPSSSSSC